jgi:hypothetical protein
MKDYVKALVQRFDNAAHLARFMGVSYDTVKSWQMGRRKATGPELRMLQVLGVIATQAPWLLEGLAHGDKLAPVLPKLDLLVFGPVTVKPATKWSDDYWHVRTVENRDDTPEIEQDLSFLNKLSEKQEARFWESCKSFEKRTGRIFPH